jgi:hypothetical protein
MNSKLPLTCAPVTLGSLGDKSTDQYPDDELTLEELDLISGGTLVTCAQPGTVTTLICPPGYVCYGNPSQCHRN